LDTCFHYHHPETAMPRPNIPQLLEDLRYFDACPLTFGVYECQNLRKRIYHAYYYHNKGWQPLSDSTMRRLTSMNVRIKSIESYLSKEAATSLFDRPPFNA
jgi:hypothetical protein